MLECWSVGGRSGNGRRGAGGGRRRAGELVYRGFDSVGGPEGEPTHGVGELAGFVFDAGDLCRRLDEEDVALHAQLQRLVLLPPEGVEGFGRDGQSALVI